LLANEPVAGIAIADPGALHVAGGGQFDQLAALAGTEVPDRFNVVVLGQDLNQFVAGPGDDVDDACRDIGGLKDLVEISGAQGRGL